MLIITQNQINPLVVTLTEKKQLSTKIYLLELINNQSNTKVYCIANDVSVSPDRYNEFCITETSQSSGGTNPFDSEVSLPLDGFYYYNIYENPDSLLVPSGLNQVETGKLLVLSNKIVVTPIYTSSINPSQQVYTQ
jgi:hypothetical protein